MYRAYNIDDLLELSDGGVAITADGASQVASAAVEKNVGSARFEGVVVVNVTACDAGNSDETYDLQVRGAAATGMGSSVQLASLSWTRGETGRVEIPFVNVRRDTVYPFVDLYVDVGGTTPSITFKAYIAEVNWG